MGFLEDGRKTEERFSEDIKKLGFLINYSTTAQDINEHWDLEIIQQKKTKIDVKGLKKLSRQNENTQEDYHFIEIKNVNGDKGWCYAEEVDAFAFETFDYWIIVKKDKLQELIKNKVKKEYVDSSKDCLYKLYKRKDRKDVITLIKTIDLMFLSEFKIEKK